MSLLPRHPLNAAGHRFEHDAMACTFEVSVIGVEARYAASAARAAFDEVDRLEQTLSRFVPPSDIARLNATTPGQAVPVAIETIECLQLAARLHDVTGGAFDIAYRSSGPRDVTPLILDPVAHAVSVQIAGVQLDLGGLGKGYAVDRMVALLREWGVPAGRVHAGQSTVRVFGVPPGEGTWRVGLRCPDVPDDTLGVIGLRDVVSRAALSLGEDHGVRQAAFASRPSPNPSLEGRGVAASALSGSGQRLHGKHIIDPRTGRPAHAARAAWAVAPGAALADGFSTAFMVLAPAEIEALCGRLADVTAILRRAGETPTLLRFGAPCRLVPGEERERWAE